MKSILSVILAIVWSGASFFAALNAGESLLYSAGGGLYRVEYTQAGLDACEYRIRQLGGDFLIVDKLDRGATTRSSPRVPSLYCRNLDMMLIVEGSWFQQPVEPVTLPYLIR